MALALNEFNEFAEIKQTNKKVIFLNLNVLFVKNNTTISKEYSIFFDSYNHH